MTDSGMSLHRIFTETAESLNPSVPFSSIMTFRKSSSDVQIWTEQDSQTRSNSEPKTKSCHLSCLPSKAKCQRPPSLSSLRCPAPASRDRVLNCTPRDAACSLYKNVAFLGRIILGFFVCFAVWGTFPCYLLHFGAKTLLNFGAKIYHLHCSSIFPLFYSIFPWCALIYPKCSSIIP